MDGEGLLLVYKDCVRLVLQLSIPEHLHCVLASLHLNHESITRTLKLYPDLRNSAGQFAERLIDACNVCDIDDMRTLQAFARGSCITEMTLCAPNSFHNLCGELHFTSQSTSNSIGLLMSVKHRPYATFTMDLLLHNAERHLRAHMTYRNAMRYDRFVVQMSRVYRYALMETWIKRLSVPEDERIGAQIEFIRRNNDLLRELSLPTTVDDDKWTECLVGFGRLYGRYLLQHVDAPLANALTDASFDANVSQDRIGEFAIAYMQLAPTNTKLSARQVVSRWGCNVILDHFLFDAIDRSRLYRACERASKPFACAVLAYSVSC